MTKFVTFFVALFITMNVNALSIERRADVDGGKMIVTSKESIFSGCQMRMARFTKDNKAMYSLVLELTDRANHVTKGNIFNIEFKDGTSISLVNMFDTASREEHHDYVETYTHYYNGFAPYYNPWHGYCGSFPMTYTWQEHVPVHTTTTYTTLYYSISKQQINQIINGKVKSVSIVTDENTIVKKARPISDVVASLYEIVG